MEKDYSKETKTLKIIFTDEIDQHIADKIRRKIDDEIERYIPRKIIFDFSNISFMDSSGIGMIMGRYKLAKILGGSTEIINVNKPIKKILEMSGISRIICVTEKNRHKNKADEITNTEYNEEEKNERII